MSEDKERYLIPDERKGEIQNRRGLERIYESYKLFNIPRVDAGG